MEKEQKDRFIILLSEVLERDENLIKATDDFRDYEEWDSLAVLSFMLMLEEEYKTGIDRKKLDECETINDLFKLIS